MGLDAAHESIARPATAKVDEFNSLDVARAIALEVEEQVEGDIPSVTPPSTTIMSIPHRGY